MKYTGFLESYASSTAKEFILEQISLCATTVLRPSKQSRPSVKVPTRNNACWRQDNTRKLTRSVTSRDVTGVTVRVFYDVSLTFVNASVFLPYSQQPSGSRDLQRYTIRLSGLHAM